VLIGPEVFFCARPVEGATTRGLLIFGVVAFFRFLQLICLS